MLLFLFRKLCYSLLWLKEGEGSMETKLVKIDPENFREEELREAAELLRAGELVAFPTETVYGLGGNALDPAASAKIYAAKGRPSDNPLIVHICETKALYELAENVPESALKVAETFWPGPLTMILRKSSLVPKETTGGLDTVAIRMPSDPVAAALIRTSGIYIAAPSANASGRPSTTRAEHVMEDLAGRIPMILDGGAVKLGLESTIIDLTGEVPMILRPGYITREMLLTVLPRVEYDPAVLKREKNENIVAKAPGMKYRHYAPKGSLTIYEGELEQVSGRVAKEAAEAAKAGFVTAVLCSEETKASYSRGPFYVLSVGTRAEEESIAANLFDALRECDHLGAERIYGESFPAEGVGQAIMNRLMKAAGYQIEKV